MTRLRQLLQEIRQERAWTQETLSRGQWQAEDDASNLRDYIKENLTLRIETYERWIVEYERATDD